MFKKITYPHLLLPTFLDFVTKEALSGFNKK